MPGFLGGSSGSSGTGGEITFPKEFIDPVTKLRVSQPENLIDTDFEYGLQPTKWETVELINNTPSFFSKSGDTTIPGILAISTNNGTREITVLTATDHGLAVGIPINVTGTKSVTADGSYVINSIPNSSTFTYLCKDEQNGNNSIEDLYTSIITGEFFQGSQIRIADAEGITTDAEAISTLTVKTDSTHGFGLNTPFYFLNLNSTISQEFEASNTAAKSFDSSNSATAQTFDGSNTLSTFNIDWSNSATVGGTTSNINTVNTTNDTITVAHGAETFANRPLGTPLYYNLTAPASSGFFSINPRGVVFLKTINALNSPAGFSTFQVSETPDGDVIDIISAMSGTFQLANQARTFAGNNRDLINEIGLNVLKTTPVVFDGGNQGFTGESGGIGETNGLSTVLGYSDTILVSVTPGAGLDYYVGAMLRYSTTGSAATNLVNNETYFVASIVPNATPNLYNITIKSLPTSGTTITPSGGTGTQTFLRIGVSITRDVLHVRNHGFTVGDMVEYTFPEGGRFSTVDNAEEVQFYFVQVVYDEHNIQLNNTVFSPTAATGGTSTSDITIPGGRSYRVHRFTTVGTSNFVVSAVGSDSNIQYLIVGGGGSGGSYVGGGGGAGGVLTGTRTLTSGTFPVVVGNGAAGVGSLSVSQVIVGNTGGPSSVFGLTAAGGGGGGVYADGAGTSGGSGGGAGGFQSGTGSGGAASPAGQGNVGGNTGLGQGRPRGFTGGGGGGGAGTAGGISIDSLNQGGDGGQGISTTITGTTLFFGGGGGGGNFADGSRPGNGGAGGGGGGGSNSRGTFGAGGGQALTTGGNGFSSGDPNHRGGNGGANTGGGGGGVGHHGLSGDGGSGVVILRYPITAPVEFTAPVATGGTTTTATTLDGTYRIHTFTNIGATNFQVQSLGNASSFEYLIVGGGGAGGSAENNQGLAGGGGAGGILAGNFTPSTITYSVVIGAGATGTSGSSAGLNGNPSSVFGLTALGGGAGGNWWNPIRTGGASGGGGGNQDGGNNVGGIGTPPQGNNGGNGSAYNGGFPNASGGGGGGGWGSIGQASTGGAGGPGGNGYTSAISGTVTTYAAGGGGTGTDRGGAPGGTSGAIGNSASGNGTSAANNRGGGGGAAGNRNNGAFTAGNGGSGIVIIRYPITVN
jgi:hypothetical protein